MSWLSEFWKSSRARRRHVRLRRSMNPAHELRRNLAYYVAHHGFEIGDHSYGSPTIRPMWSDTRLIVGKYCSIAEGVQFILGGNHHLDHVTTFPLSRMTGVTTVPEGPFSRGDIVLGSDVWIGAGATVMSGVTIGDGAIVGSMAVVASDVPAYGVVVGNPAKLLRKRFPDDVVARLLEARWWDLPDQQVKALQPLLQSPEIEQAIAAIHAIGNDRQQTATVRPRATTDTASPTAGAEPRNTPQLAERQINR